LPQFTPALPQFTLLTSSSKASIIHHTICVRPRRNDALQGTGRASRLKSRRVVEARPVAQLRVHPFGRRDTLDTKDLLSLVFERYAAAQTFWNIYIIVTLGLLGFIASAKEACSRKPVQVVLTVVFVGFAQANLHALWIVNRQQSELAAAADDKLPTQGQL